MTDPRPTPNGTIGPHARAQPGWRPRRVYLPDPNDPAFASAYRAQAARVAAGRDEDELADFAEPAAAEAWRDLS